MFAVLSYACRGPGEDQRQGVLELLLTTPLGEEAYLRGRMLTLKRRCLLPLLGVLAVDAGLMVAGCWHSGRVNWEWVAWIGVCVVLALKLVIDLYAMAWVGLWQGLKARNTASAISTTTFYVLLNKWILLSALLAAFGVITNGRVFDSGAGPAVAVVGYVALFLMTILHACGLAISELRDNLRSLAQGWGMDNLRSFRWSRARG
jgi:hypothetical protein